MPILAAILFALAVSLPWAPKALATNHIDAQVILLPASKSLTAKVKIQLPSPRNNLEFRLHHDLAIFQNTNFQIVKIGEDGIANIYKLQATNPSSEFTITYQGSIFEPINENDSPGIISDIGVTLMGDSYWLPTTNETFTYKIKLNTREDWQALTSGKILEEGKGYRTFASEFAVSYLTLVANQFFVFKSDLDPRLEVWLLKDEPDLAKSYLQKGAEYLKHYTEVLGAYPFSRYTIVENFIETGFAVPAFTLLGSSVIRLPFILTSSLPHEILHSWWGNSIEVDYNSGNWCEGLTTHMADHWLQNSNQTGSKYRRKTLQGFQDFVRSETDFPVRKFVAKNDAGTQAVGYGKSMMFFNMLELYIGADPFREALASFYQKHKFQVASFVDIQKSMEQISGKDLSLFFNNWLDQTGAPTLRLGDTSITESHGHFELSFNLELEYKGQLPLFPVQYVVELSGGQKLIKTLVLDKSTTTVKDSYPERPIKLDVDPFFNSFRTLYAQETPPAFSRVLGAQNTIYISYPQAEANIWQGWTDSLRKILPSTPVLISDQMELPKAGAIWILGSNNLHLKSAESLLANRGLVRTPSGWSYKNTAFDLASDAIFAVESIQELNLMAVISQPQASHEILIAKLPHYSSFSLAVFRNNKNLLREEYQPSQSPLSKAF